VPSFFLWRRKYAGVSAADVKGLRELDAENAKLKRMYADLRAPITVTGYAHRVGRRCSFPRASRWCGPARPPYDVTPDGRFLINAELGSVDYNR
jgi:hypothetical protein